MILQLRPACLTLALAVTAGPACAQTWLYETDYGARAYVQPRVLYQERYAPRAYYDAYAYQPVVTGPAVRRTVVTRTVTERTVIVTERRHVVARPVAEAYAWAPPRAARVVTRPLAYDAYAWAPRAWTPPVARVIARPAVTEAYAWAPAPAARVVTPPIAYDAYAYSPIARPTVTTVPAVTTVPVVTNVPVVTSVPVVQQYRYVNPLAVNPVTGVFLSDE
jgi:hypothetical protein